METPKLDPVTDDGMIFVLVVEDEFLLRFAVADALRSFGLSVVEAANYTTMSQIQLVYGALTTAIAVLLSVEIGALVLLFGAQVIAEYERVSREPIESPSRPVKLQA